MDSKNALLIAALSGLALSVSGAEATKSTQSSKIESEVVDGQCFGVNSCKGTSACHSEKNSCAGTNSCKGKGWIKLSNKGCKKKKGTFKKFDT